MLAAAMRASAAVLKSEMVLAAASCYKIQKKHG
jgi:hypothetical protein